MLYSHRRDFSLTDEQFHSCSDFRRAVNAHEYDIICYPVRIKIVRVDGDVSA